MCYNGSWVRLPSCEGGAAPSSVTFAAEPSCAEGPSIVPGFNCTPACVDGYAPSEGYFYCPVPGSETVVAEREDMLTFPTFGCDKVPECQAPPPFQNSASAGSCLEGASVLAGASCSTACAGGYSPSVLQLACTAQQEVRVCAYAYVRLRMPIHLYIRMRMRM